jgi:microcystin-dependent protein
MDNQYLADVQLFAGSFVPQDFGACTGSIIDISLNPALYSLLGTTYGGDGRASFGLPDLRGRVAVSQGAGPGLQGWRRGEIGGSELTTLSEQNMPQHKHAITNAAGTVSLFVSEDEGDSDDPVTGVLANSGNAQYKVVTGPVSGSLYNGGNSGTCSLNGDTGNAGAQRSFSNIQPTLALNYVICMAGLFPSRS